MSRDDDDREPAEVATHDHAGMRDSRAESADGTRRPGRRALVILAVLGVAYGDLGTSAIYSLHTVFNGTGHVLDPSAQNVRGILSLVFWTLIVVVSLKYMIFVLRADNRGEGGTFALIALLRPWHRIERRQRRLLVLLGLAGAAMLYAGVMITPAISILSAVEGLKTTAPDLQSWVVPITLGILVALFAVQRLGTARVGAAFGPVMAVWFIAIAALGVYGITRAPGVLAAVNPSFAVDFLLRHGVVGLIVLFAIFLVTTGAEALYADIGHLGRRPIRILWFTFVLPALLLNYFGQGAMLLADPRSGVQPFYHLVPPPLLWPMVVLATIATVIASQAAITGSFSMTRQAGRLGMMPPMRVVQTSAHSSGQVYVPAMNWTLMAAAMVLVVLFGSSERLASTYGISVNTTMLVTTVLAFVVARERGRWPLWGTVPLLVVFATVDVVFLTSNVLRIPAGGWFPIAVAALLFTVMSTWRRGGELLARRTNAQAHPVAELVRRMRHERVARVRGTAVFLTPWLEDTPPSVDRHIRRNRALQKQVVLLTVLIEDVPRTDGDERIEFHPLGHGFFRVVLHYGYLQSVNVPSELTTCSAHGLRIDPRAVTYYVEHDAPLLSRGRIGGMARWRGRLFSLLSRNALDPTTRYRLPADQVVDMGLRVRI